MKPGNIALGKSYQFSLDIINAYKRLQQAKEYTMAKQLLRCGTSIGANVEEAIGGHSKQDFGWKISIAYKEAREAHYWIRLLIDSGYLNGKDAKSLLQKADELMRILGSIQKTVLGRKYDRKENY